MKILQPVAICTVIFVTRDAAEIITPSITHIVNKSIEQGQFPNDLKIARVIPLYKKGSKQDPRNYRPVSILSSLSKIIEKITFLNKLTITFHL